MKPVPLSALFLAACLCGTALAEPPAAPLAGQAAPGHPSGCERGPMAFPHGPMGHHGMPQLHGVKLSEAQHDRLFALMHAQAPQMREQHKNEHKAREALRAMIDAGQFDEGKAAAQAKALGAAVAARELQHARMASQAMALLTPEQREQLRQHRAERASAREAHGERTSPRRPGHRPGQAAGDE